MLGIIRYTLLSALRDRVFLGICLTTLAAYMLALLFGGSALAEEAQFVRAFYAGALRLILALGTIVFICFTIRRAYEYKEIEVALSRPISRSRFVVAYWGGFACVAMLMLLPGAVLLAFLPGGFHTGHTIWLLSFALELLIVVSISVCVGLIFRSAITATFACAAFYLLGRMMGFFLAMVDSPKLASEAARHVLQYISAIIPRLDLFAQSSWLTGAAPLPAGEWYFLAQAAIMVPLLLSIAVIDFRRRQF